MGIIDQWGLGDILRLTWSQGEALVVNGYEANVECIYCEQSTRVAWPFQYRISHLSRSTFVIANGQY